MGGIIFVFLLSSSTKSQVKKRTNSKYPLNTRHIVKYFIDIKTPQIRWLMSMR